MDLKSANESNRIQELHALEAMLEYARISAAEIGAISLAAAIDDAKKIAVFDMRASSGMPMQVHEA